MNIINFKTHSFFKINEDYLYNIFPKDIVSQNCGSTFFTEVDYYIRSNCKYVLFCEKDTNFEQWMPSYLNDYIFNSKNCMSLTCNELIIKSIIE